jgi:HlyD family secretion protein
MKKRYLLPLAGLLLTIATVVQLDASRDARPAAAPASSAPQQTKITAEGRVAAYPGAEITVGSDIAGVVERILVDEKDAVRKGAVVATLRADDARAALGEAQSRIREAEADIRLFDLERQRARKLWEDEVGSRQAWDRAERDLDAARARRESAVAEARRLDAVVAKAVITSPIDGTITARFVHPGEAIAAGAQVVTVADLTKRRVEAEIDEYDAARVAIGAEVRISAEGHAKSWSGTVEEIPDTVVSRRLKPQDPAKPIDTRVLLVKVKLTEDAPLKLAQRVEVELDGTR